MFKITFNNYQDVSYNGFLAIAKFVLCFKYIEFQSGDIIVSDDDISCAIYKKNIQSIEHVKPTDL